jgi:hypothetical protein
LSALTWCSYATEQESQALLAIALPTAEMDGALVASESKVIAIYYMFFIICYRDGSFAHFLYADLQRARNLNVSVNRGESTNLHPYKVIRLL